MYTVTARDKFTSFLSLAPPEESEGFDIYHNYLIEQLTFGEYRESIHRHAENHSTRHQRIATSRARHSFSVNGIRYPA